ncbi:MAG: hypothetical protein IJR14_03020 [Synergistaceae bacterium]|nr:hypothetical protein [Synergistaceae bacterium]
MMVKGKGKEIFEALWAAASHELEKERRRAIAADNERDEPAFTEEELMLREIKRAAAALAIIIAKHERFEREKFRKHLHYELGLVRDHIEDIAELFEVELGKDEEEDA